MTLQHIPMHPAAHTLTRGLVAAALSLALGHAHAAGLSSSVSLSNLRVSVIDVDPTDGMTPNVRAYGSTQVGLSTNAGVNVSDSLSIWMPDGASTGRVEFLPVALQSNPAQGAQLSVGTTGAQQVSVSTSLRTIDDVWAAAQQSTVTYAASPESYIGIHPETGVSTYYRRQGTRTYTQYELSAKSWVGSASDGFANSTGQTQPLRLSMSEGAGRLHVEGDVTFTMSLDPDLVQQLQPSQWEYLNTSVQGEALVFLGGQGFDVITLASLRDGAAIQTGLTNQPVSLQNGQLSFTRHLDVTYTPPTGVVTQTDMYVRLNVTAGLYGLKLTADNTTVVWGSPVRPVVPEPGTWAQMALGLIGLVAAVRQRRA